VQTRRRCRNWASPSEEPPNLNNLNRARRRLCQSIGACVMRGRGVPMGRSLGSLRERSCRLASRTCSPKPSAIREGELRELQCRERVDVDRV